MAKQQEAFDFDAFWKSGPWFKAGKRRAQQRFKATVKTRGDWNRIQGARDRYVAYLSLNPWMHAQHGSTWFNQWEDWVPEEAVATADPKSHLCQYCQPEHEWACENPEECTSTRELACPTFIREFKKRQQERL